MKYVLIILFAVALSLVWFWQEKNQNIVIFSPCSIVVKPFGWILLKGKF
jgi:hypothetical protein